MSTTPMTPTQWLLWLGYEGLGTVEYKSWRTHDRDDETGKAFGPVNGVVIHHTAGVDSLELCYSGNSTLPGPRCHGHLPKTGIVNMLSAGRANHAGGFAQNAHDAVLREDGTHPYPDAEEPVDGNDHYYGLEVENLGNGTDPYPWVQYVAAVRWATAICRFHGWGHDSVIGHKEGTRRKIDPKGPVVGPDGKQFDFTMNRFRADVKAALALPAGVWPKQEEEDVALTDADAQKVLDIDYVPAARPPYNNPDYNADPPNLLWSLKYMQLAQIEGIRETRAKVTALGDEIGDLQVQVAAIQASVAALALGGVDLDALAVKVADEIYRRMAA